MHLDDEALRRHQLAELRQELLDAGPDALVWASVGARDIAIGGRPQDGHEWHCLGPVEGYWNLLFPTEPYPRG
ncbi:MAG TPA: hypothetical protein VFS21_02610 [Roseiflexaceae bacterium]|nr:hypothetical protein [Roseiflexaceae bacterium]